jgi:prevent-host-death family protein
MNKPVTAAEAKAMLSALLDRAAAGQETVITRHGKPVARVAPLAPEQLPPRKPGRWKGLIEIDDALLMAPMSEEELRGWEGAYSDDYGITLPEELARARALAAKAKRRRRRG